MQLLEEWEILVSCLFFISLLISMVDLDWEDNASDTNERKMASVINGEDWDREAHTGHLFNDEELRQLNG